MNFVGRRRCPASRNLVSLGSRHICWCHGADRLSALAKINVAPPVGGCDPLVTLGSDAMNVPFGNRSEQIFGREADLQWLLRRVESPGLTVIAARPLMGKSWTLLDLARRLTEQGSYVVGYHEYKGGETSHLLYAVANLYENWLGDSTMLQQAVSLWQQHKDELFPRVAQFVGPLLSALVKAKGAPSAVGELVKTAFDQLAEAATQLKTGGLDLSPLPYDQALSLVRVVATVSKRSPVLMLDAWEKSGAQRQEYATLQSFLKHSEDWAGAHVFLTRRDPPSGAERDDRSQEYVHDLQRYSPQVAIRALAGMALDDPQEVARVSRFLRFEIPVANGVTDERLCQLIAGYPGVLNFWLHAVARSQVQSLGDLVTLAQQAQSNLYAELDGLLKDLYDSERAFACQIAVLPRLNADTWRVLKAVLPVQATAATVDRLVNCGLLEPGAEPRFGHDTRHWAVRQSFARLFRHSFTELAGQTVQALAAHCTSTDQHVLPYLSPLAALHELSEFIALDAPLACLVAATRSVFSDNRGVCSGSFMSAHRAAATLSAGATFLIASGLIHRASQIKNNEDPSEDGLRELEASLTLPGISDPSVSMALYNRGITRGQRGNFRDAIEDFTAVLEMDATPGEFRARARCNRGNSFRKLGDIEGALREFAVLVAEANCPAEPLTKALIARGEIAEEQQDLAGALADYTAALEVPGIAVSEITWAHNNRGRVYNEQLDWEAACADFETVTKLPNAPRREVVNALTYRADLLMELGETARARADCEAVLRESEVTTEQRAAALYHLGWIKSQEGDPVGADLAYTAVIELPHAPLEFLTMAWINRGVNKYQADNYVGALADYTAALQLSGISAEHRAHARYNCGVVNDLQGKVEDALSDYSTVIESPDAPVRWVALSLYKRAEIRVRLKNLAAACKDMRRCIDLPGAPDEVIVEARDRYRSWNCLK
jgi:tetratricopeptide (TPR) repeat protein